MIDGSLLQETVFEVWYTLISPSVLPALSPNGSKKPRGDVWPASPSADIDTFVNAGRAMTAGRNATAEAAREATMIVWNIVGAGVDKIVLHRLKSNEMKDEVVGMMHSKFHVHSLILYLHCRFAGGKLTDMTHAQ